MRAFSPESPALLGHATRPGKYRRKEKEDEAKMVPLPPLAPPYKGGGRRMDSL